MTQHEIVALKCPSCGGGITQPSREMAFGAEFSCSHCGVTSVLIIDRALVPLGTLQQHGDKVCVACGRIATREARFCQQGHALVQKCPFPDCREEFSVDHQLCDFCGRSPREDPVTHVYRAVVTGVLPHGAFVTMQSGKGAFLHVTYFPERDTKTLKEGQQLHVRIVEETPNGIKVTCIGVPQP